MSFHDFMYFYVMALLSTVMMSIIVIHGIMKSDYRTFDVGISMVAFAVFYTIVRMFYYSTTPLDVVVIMAWHVVPPVAAAAALEAFNRAFPPPRF